MRHHLLLPRCIRRLLPSSEDAHRINIPDRYGQSGFVVWDILENSDLPIAVPPRIDSRLKKHDQMPVSEFLKEVQDTDDSLGYRFSGNVVELGGQGLVLCSGVL